MSKVAGSYKRTHTLSARRRDAEKVRERAPDRILVICEKVENSPVPDLDKSKFLVPPDATVGGFLVSIRRRITMEAEKALFLFVADSVPANSTLMSDLYNTYKDEDGFLYVTYSGENTYG
ncbi:ATG8/AUT7/APG8/PAZ2 putative (ATG8) [Leptomonas pyrrhocoris]|uniref:Autophagy-related protein n=1 Tax=Leptomonas pyrrhocoris TaxID=157538 RepID=A0A0M9G613_LEPPY|nr:ATG8/AUT7/APG8/PAZ2 putative (ATG8) [Leptomonas pyrrhocoris]XP_015661366.1 ATG8/AUT7/APG8/PAZ2 putative (ATG8) [Leptomonas pyrrhocoris]KPA82926.1 ATG8/AUT7/APG8/PAZ2 putative (ATG8) [Leptomonas pyrrhocoris]KPA82927.1 ATG8/AUT7/APG8/PAZ2 putative (ATG8) [Leptomonas pyrrhocoris]|eukprot:XP_015661365.1 ATG8/AUT7/APG8/PAZ2 putative (ATG8) [Leptomonas pyrrhocoris]